MLFQFNTLQEEKSVIVELGESQSDLKWDANGSQISNGKYRQSPYFICPMLSYLGGSGANSFERAKKQTLSSFSLHKLKFSPGSQP